MGGGATGLETAGLLAEKYPMKRIGIISRANVLLANIPFAHETIFDYITESLKIKLHLG